MELKNPLREKIGEEMYLHEFTNKLVGTNNYLFLTISKTKRGKKEVYYTSSSVIQRQVTEFNNLPVHVELIQGSGRKGRWFAFRLLS